MSRDTHFCKAIHGRVDCAAEDCGFCDQEEDDDE